MKRIEQQPTEEHIIIIEDDDVQDSGHAETASDASEEQFGAGDDFHICIEEDDEPSYIEPLREVRKPMSRKKKWCLGIGGVVLFILILFGAYKGLRLYNYYNNIGVSISRSPKENIERLASMKATQGPSEIIVRQDTILGVALGIYELHNVRADLEMQVPDTTDESVMLYARASDYTPEHRFIGSLVVDGETIEKDVTRLGYCGMKDGNMVIGISRHDDLRTYAEEEKGSMFRQYILVSNGELPSKFHLHGKVERKALARMANDVLCIVETKDKETMWDFADALREEGFVDAIYLTGGNALYMKAGEGSGIFEADGKTPHVTTKARCNAEYKKHIPAPWLVLRKR